MPSHCEAQSYGYRCDRLNGHGSLHYDATETTWWVQDFASAEEWADHGATRPATGYRIIDDELLPDEPVMRRG